MIYDYKNYKDIIKAQIKEFSHIKGYRAKLAEVAKCHRSVISQVLNTSSVHLSFEQGAYLTQFWSFDTRETRFFINLIGLARAGNQILRSYYQNQITELKKENQDFANRYTEKRLDKLSQQALYYSSWQNIAIHVLLSIDGFNTPEAIANKLSISTSEVENALSILEKLDLIDKNGNCWRQKVDFLHLPKSSPLTVVNHINWRHRAITSVQKKEDSNLFFSSAFSCSLEGFEEIKSIILQAIDSVRTVTKNSDAEEIYSLNFDLFKI